MTIVKVNIENQTVDLNDKQINFIEAGIYSCTDNDDIIEKFESEGYKVEIEKFKDLEKVLDYAEKETRFIRGCGDDAYLDFSPKELKDLGWVMEYDNGDEIPDEIDIQIKVNEIGQTFWSFSIPKINEMAEFESTGDDKQTILDIVKLKEIK